MPKHSSEWWFLPAVALTDAPLCFVALRPRKSRAAFFQRLPQPDPGAGKTPENTPSPIPLEALPQIPLTGWEQVVYVLVLAACVLPFLALFSLLILMHTPLFAH